MPEQTIPSPCLIVDSEVQLSTLTTTNVDECFPHQQPIGKQERRQYEEGGQVAKSSTIKLKCSQRKNEEAREIDG